MGAEQGRSIWREYLEALLVAALFLGFTNTFVLKTFYIPSGSMEDTLLVGDHLIVNRFIYGSDPTSWLRPVLPIREPERGDIVVFRSPQESSVDLVKRLVGLPRDTIRIVDKELFVNGERVEDSHYTKHGDRTTGADRRNVTLYRRDNFGPYTVPPDHYFFLGDNRDFSYDSRYWGPVPDHFVKGRTFLIYWSYGGETPDGQWRGIGAKMRHLTQTAAGFFSKTRWRRTFEIPR